MLVGRARSKQRFGLSEQNLVKGTEVVRVVADDNFIFIPFKTFNLYFAIGPMALVVRETI